MEEPIIIDTKLYPDEEYEPLRKTLAKVLTKPEALKVYAGIIKHECKMHQNCQDCPMFGVYTPDLPECTCPFFNSENPEDWLVN